MDGANTVAEVSNPAFKPTSTDSGASPAGFAPERSASSQSGSGFSNVHGKSRRNMSISAKHQRAPINEASRNRQISHDQLPASGIPTGSKGKGFFKYENSILYHIPILNIFWSAVDGKNADPPSFAQIAKMLETISIAAALVLALVLTVHSAVEYDELHDANNRFLHKVPPCDVLQQEGCKTYTFYSREKHFDCGTDTDNDRGVEVPRNYCKYWWERQGDKTGTPVENFNWNCCVSIALLNIALLMSILILSTGSTNVFANEHALQHGFQARQVMKVYLHWVRFPLVVCIIGLLCGIIAFFNAIQMMVLVKYPDIAVDDTAETDYSWTSPFGWVDFSLFYLMYLPLIGAILMVSMGTHRAYMYKVRPDGDTVVESERPVSRQELKKFLFTWCALNDDNGNIFLSGAGGIPSSEVEVVADALIDHGLTTPEDLLFMVRNTQDTLGEVGGIQLNARTCIIVGCKNYMENLRTQDYMGRSGIKGGKTKTGSQSLEIDPEYNLWMDQFAIVSQFLAKKIRAAGFNLDDLELKVMSNLFVDQGLVEEDIIEAAASNLVILNTIEDLHLGSRVKIFKSFTKVYKSTLSA